MKKMTNDEYKKALVGILKYFDDLCRQNNIKYSIIAGSMIGAVREGGIIPWDDDIDVALMPNQYKKLLNALKREDKNGRFKPLIPLETEGYYMPYMKIVDSKTYLIEENVVQKKNSGVFIDVFKYGYVEQKHVKKHFRKTAFYRKALAIIVGKKEKNNNLKSILKNLRRAIYSRFFTYKSIVMQFNKLYNNDKKTDHVMINFPLYGPTKDLQNIMDTKEYIDYKFEGINVMMFKNYDNILRTTYGDYMTPPPKKDRITHHHMTAYWK